MDYNKNTIFIHIPKTAGNTIMQILFRQYGIENVIHVKNNQHAFELKNFDKFKSHDFNWVTGHMAFGHHIQFDDPDKVIYFTMLREPVKRVISYYNYILKQKGHYLHKTIVDNNLTLKQFVESGVDVHTENNQVRLLSDSIQVPHGECSKQLLDKAKHNLENYFSVVGINEMFDESLLLAKEFYGWKLPLYTYENVNKKYKKPTTEIDEDTINTIKKYNSLDIELYEWAKKRLEDEVESKGSKFQKSLKNFRFLNSVAQKVVPVRNKIIGRKR